MILLLNQGSFILKADIEGKLAVSVSARDGISLKDAFWEKLENTGCRKWENFLVFTKITRVHVEWEMNVSCVRGHALLIVNRLDTPPLPLPGAHHFVRKDVINTAVGPYCEKDFYYLIRPSGSARNMGSFALVITTPSYPSGRSCLRHVTIQYVHDTGRFILCSKEFDCLDSLVEFFKSTPIKAHNGPNMYLRYPIPVDPQLDEECKKPWRTTRTGGRTDPDIDTISLWSCSSSVTGNSLTTPMSYDYEGSVSGMSEDDAAYDTPRTIIRKFSKHEGTTSPVSDGSNHVYASDTEMRHQSGSSISGSSLSGSFSSSSSTPVSKSRGVYHPQQGRQRPHSEVIRKQSSCDLTPGDRDYPRTQSSPNLPRQQLQFSPTSASSGPEESYVQMTMISRLPVPDPIYQIPTNPATCPDSDPATLTRVTDSGYMNISIKPPEPDQTYVDMSTLRPRQLQPLPPSPPSPLDLPTISEHQEYLNHAPLPPPPMSPCCDPVTTHKLIENVQHLMSTVEEQSKEIYSLKVTVKDLKRKLELLERLNTEEFSYAE